MVVKPCTERSQEVGKRRIDKASYLFYAVEQVGSSLPAGQPLRFPERLPGAARIIRQRQDLSQPEVGSSKTIIFIRTVPRIMCSTGFSKSRYCWGARQKDSALCSIRYNNMEGCTTGICPCADQAVAVSAVIADFSHNRRLFSGAGSHPPRHQSGNFGVDSEGDFCTYNGYQVLPFL